MQSLLEYEAEERRYQSLAAAEGLAVEDPEVAPAPPSYTAEATATPWVSHSFLPREPEVACGVSLDSIPEDTATTGSLYHMSLASSPLTQPDILEAPADLETETSAVHDSDLDSDGTLAELPLTVNEPAQATGVSFRVRPVHWAPSPIVRARELIESSSLSEITHRRAGNSRQGSYHSNTASGGSRSRDGTPSRRPSTDNHPPRAGSRQNSDPANRLHGPHAPAPPRTAPGGEGRPGSPRVSLRGRSRQPYLFSDPAFISSDPYVRVDAAQATAKVPAETFIDDTFPGPTTHIYPPTYSPVISLQSFTIPERSSVPPNSPVSSPRQDLIGSPQQTTDPLPQRPSSSTRMQGTPVSGQRNGALCNVYMHANYSNPTIYPSIVSAAGLNYGTPFGSPMAFAPAVVPPLSPRAPLGHMPVPSRSSTGNFPLHAALDAMQSPSQGPIPMVDGAGTDSGETYVDIEESAVVQQNALSWKPAWDVFPLKVYRGFDLKVVEDQRNWDDEDLLRELGAAYDKLRGRLRKYFSFMDVWYVTMVAAEKQYVFPQRVGPAKISAHRNMRMRYLLAHPEHMKGQREIMRALTARRGYGVEFVEQAQLVRMALFTGSLFFIVLAITAVYGACTGDWMGAFAIGSFFGQNFALPVGLLQVAASYLMRDC